MDAVSALPRDLLTQAIDRKDINAVNCTVDERLPELPCHRIIVPFNTPIIYSIYVNDPDITSHQLLYRQIQGEPSPDNAPDYAKVSLDWKKLTTSFFAEEVYVCHKLTILRRTPATSALPNPTYCPHRSPQDTSHRLSKSRKDIQPDPHHVEARTSSLQ
jgi:hypothetical protein